MQPRQQLDLILRRADGRELRTSVLSRLDTDNEAAYFRCGGILQYVLNNLVAAAGQK